MKITDQARAVLKTTTAKDLMEHSEEYDGFCITCGEWTSGCEPDAREYRCDSCGRRTVYGAEELIFLII